MEDRMPVVRVMPVESWTPGEIRLIVEPRPATATLPSGDGFWSRRKRRRMLAELPVVFRDAYLNPHSRFIGGGYTWGWRLERDEAAANAWLEKHGLGGGFGIGCENGGFGMPFVFYVPPKEG